MTLSTLKKLIFPSMITSGIVFAAMTLPLAIMGENQVGIKIQEESFFHGRLRDVASPYVIFATLLSLGAGISVAALGGWKDSTRKFLDYKSELSRLEKHLEQKEALLQEFKLSESSLQTSGLKSFLNDKVTVKDSQKVEAFSIAVTQPVFAQNSVSVSEYAVEQGEYNFANVENSSDYKQSDISFKNTVSEIEETATVDETNSALSEFEQLQLQLQDMMSKMQQLQIKVESSRQS